MSSRGIAVSVIAVLLVAASAAPAAAGRARIRRVADGIVHTVYKKRSPRLVVQTITISRRRVSDIRAALGSGRLPGWERTTSIARRHRAVVAINGDYGRRSGRPVMAFAHAGHLVQTPLVRGGNFAVAPAERTSFIGHPRTSLWLGIAGQDLPVPRLNNGGPYGNQVAMFDRSGGHIERPPQRACSARIVPVELPRPDATRSGFVTRHRVKKVRCGRARLAPRRGRVVSARRDAKKAELIRSLQEGSTVTLGWSLGWAPVREAIGGNPTLVEQGRVVVGDSADPFFARHPRTGVGITGSGKVIFVTVDGRQRRSVGMTLRGFARFFRARGAEWALNLDGGGSTTMVVRGRITNNPSDGSERAVSSALVVLRRSSGGTTRREPEPPPDEPPPWSILSADPASTGGLAASLRRGGAELPPDLRRAARRTVSRPAR